MNKHKTETKKDHDKELRELTIEKILERSAGLWLLYHSAKNDRARGGRKQRDAWYNYYKPVLSNLVGWDKEPFDPILSTSEAWNLAHRLIHDEVFKLKGRKIIET